MIHFSMITEKNKKSPLSIPPNSIVNITNIQSESDNDTTKLYIKSKQNKTLIAILTPQKNNLQVNLRFSGQDDI